jgi:hypothetical protein
MKLKTKQQIEELINSGLSEHEIRHLYYGIDDPGLPHPLFDYDGDESYKEQRQCLTENLTQVYYKSGGDGNELDITIEVVPYNLFINLEGTYSSWDSNSFNDCYLSVPYVFQETRFKRP